MKRSHTVVAILAAATVGGTAYALMPSETCRRADGGAPLDPSAAACRGSGSGGSGGYHNSRSYFGSSDSGGSHGSGGSGSGSSGSAGTSRGGFGGSFGFFGGGS